MTWFIFFCIYLVASVIGTIIFFLIRFWCCKKTETLGIAKQDPNNYVNGSDYYTPTTVIGEDSRSSVDSSQIVKGTHTTLATCYDFGRVGQEISHSHGSNNSHNDHGNSSHMVVHEGSHDCSSTGHDYGSGSCDVGHDSGGGDFGGSDD